MDRLDAIIADIRTKQPDAAAPQAKQERAGATAARRFGLPGRKEKRQEPQTLGDYFKQRKVIAFFVLVALLIVNAQFLTPKPTAAKTAAAVAQPSAAAVAKAVDTVTVSGAEVVLQPTPAAWLPVIVALDGRRARAILEGRAPLLDAVDAAGSPALAADRALLTDLATQRLHADAVPLQVVEVIERSVQLDGTSRTAELRVRDTMGAYTLRDAAGVVVQQVAARGERVWTVRLRFVDGSGWRVVSVISAASR